MAQRKRLSDAIVAGEDEVFDQHIAQRVAQATQHERNAASLERAWARLRKRHRDLSEGFEDEIETAGRKVVADALANGADPDAVMQHMDSDAFVDAVGKRVRSRIRQLQSGEVVESQRQRNHAKGAEAEMAESRAANGGWPRDGDPFESEPREAAIAAEDFEH